MDEFSDDDLDGLNLDELASLENNAIQATQARPQDAAPPYRPQTTQLDLNYIDAPHDGYYGAEYGQADASYPAVLPPPPAVDDSGFARPPQLVPAAVAAGPGRAVPIQRQHHSAFPPYKPPVQPSAAGGSGAAIPPSRPNQHQYGSNVVPAARAPPYQYQQPTSIGTQFTKPPLPGTQAPPFPRPPSRSNFAPPELSQAFPSSTQNNSMVEALKNRIRALEVDLSSARGEVSIVRSKHNKSIQDHDQEMQRIRRHHTEQLVSHEETTRIAQRAEKSAATELEFARRDLREDFNRAQRKDTTPKKANRSFGTGDGFNDLELAPSPSKPQGRTAKNVGSVALPIMLAERTPKAKRKRAVVDSPLKPLKLVDPLKPREVEDDDVVMRDNSQPKSQSQASSLPSPHPPDPLFHKYTKLLLDHRTMTDRLGTFEVMSNYSLPDQPNMPFTNVYLHRIPDMGDPSDPITLLADFATFTLELWNDCLAQQYYEPVSDLLALVTFTLHLDIDVVPRILSLFLPVAQSTCLTIVAPRFQATNGTDLGDEYHTKLAKNIDVGCIVSVMHLAALACASAPLDPDTKTNAILHQFWCLVEPNLIFLGLSPKQPIQDYLAILRLVQTSALPDTIGPIADHIETDPNSAPETVADALIDRLTSHIRMHQAWGKSTDERHGFTLTVLQTLIAFAASPFGRSRFLAPPRALSRLVCLLCAYVDELYQSDVPLWLALDNITVQTPDDEEEGQTKLDSHMQPTIYDVISSAMLLLHAVITNPKADATLQLRVRLETIPGSWERYLVTLARLEFAEEDLILERGIDSKTLDLAHELLDLIVTPDPGLGEQIVALFGDE